MIKVEFIYKTQTKDLEKLMEKFQLSADPKFASTPSNIGIDMFKQEEAEVTYIILDIYYNNKAEYEARTKFERSLTEWNNIWFNKANKHEEVSVKVFEVLRKN